MNRIIPFLFIILLVSCSGKDKVPKTVIQPEKMQEVLWDVFLSEAWARQSAIADSTLVLSDEVKRKTEKVLAFHGVSEKRFFESYDWYLKHPAIFRSLLDSLHNLKTKPDIPDEMDDGINEEEPPQPRLDRMKQLKRPQRAE